MSLSITTRLTAAWTLSGLIVFGAYGVYLVKVERTELQAAAERELMLLGSSLKVAVENAMRDGQFEDVDETAAMLEQIDATVDVFVHAPDGAVLLSTGRRSGAEPSWLAVAGPEGELHWVPEDRPERLLLVATLQEPGRGPFGSLVVSRSLADVQRDLTRTSNGIAVTVAVFVLTSALLGWVLGSTYIGRPLSRLTRAMQEVRGGEMAPGLIIEREDEVGALAAEFDGMMAELRDARARLRAEADARRDLQQALQRADKLITLGQLAATVAHEIGSPLQVLHGRARALLRRADEPDKVRHHAEILVRETERVARIVEQLLATTRHRPQVRVRVDLAHGVRQAVDLLELEASRRGVSLVSDAHAAHWVEGDPDRLQQVVLNLLSNALAATPRGGRVEAALAHADGEIRLAVTDTGSGMADEVAERVFEPFFTTRAAQGGTGLGMSIVQGIVDQHGGRIDIATSPETGTTVTVRLPALDTPPEPSGGTS